MGAEIFHKVDEEHVTCWLHHCPQLGRPIARDPSRHPPRAVPSWAQVPGGETKGAEIFHRWMRNM